MHVKGTGKQADHRISTSGIIQAVLSNSDLPVRAWGAASTITGRETLQNDVSIANTTLMNFYSNTHDDPKAHILIPSEKRRRTSKIRTPGRHHRGTDVQRATVSGSGL